MRIVHVTSVHPWYDTRIYYRMCRSLAEAGHQVHLVAAGSSQVDAAARQRDEGVELEVVARRGGRIRRLLWTARAVMARARRIPADVYHLHDPELLRFAGALQRKTGRPVVYDAHEDFREQVRLKHWLPPGMRALVACCAGALVERSAGGLDAVVAATPGIAERFAGHRRCVVVHNFPDLREFEQVDMAARRPGCFAYVGALGRCRGLPEMIEAVHAVGPSCSLALAGPWHDPRLRRECLGLPGWSRVREYGVLDRREVVGLLARSWAGLVILQPTPTYLRSYPVKLFEYMAMALPVVASDFPLWRELTADGACGLLVDPRDAGAVASAMKRLLEQPEQALKMGARGRKLVEERYNWHGEFDKLLALYRAVT